MNISLVLPCVFLTLQLVCIVAHRLGPAGCVYNWF